MDGKTRLVLGIWIFFTDVANAGSVTFTYIHHYLGAGQLAWLAAKNRCDCIGHLAVLDTEEKQMALLDQVTILEGRCAWIGVSNLNSNQQYRWIKLPPNYSTEMFANGESLSNTYSNFPMGAPEITSDFQGVCVFDNGTWTLLPGGTKEDYICQWTEITRICDFSKCSPGMYKGKQPTTMIYCLGEHDTCLPCPGEKIKTSPGDSVSLCDVDCGGGSKVANAEHTACECNAGYYGSGNDTCTLCPDNTIKSVQGDASDCYAETPCDGVSNEPNAGHTACVCKAGYYRDDQGCTMCTENTIKTTAGNAQNCDENEPCNGETTEPNQNHTDCECSAGYYRSGSICVVCTGNDIKSAVGNVTYCADTCDGSSTVPNVGHTACECNAGYYRISGICLLCPDNKIKKMTGDKSHCDEDTACDGKTKIPNHNHTACVCIPGYFETGSTCQPCLSFISGSGGEVMIDGDTNTCSSMPIPTIEGAIPQYQLGINGTCTKNAYLRVTMGTSATCSDLRSALFTEKPRSGCNGVMNHFDVCDVAVIFQRNGKGNVFSRVCLSTRGCHATITYDVLDLTIQGLQHM